MTIAEILVRSIITFIRTDDELRNKTVVASYDSNINPVPIDNGIITIGIEKLSISDRIKVIGENGEEITTNDRTATAQIKFTFYVPYSYGCVMAYELFDKVFTLFLNATGSYHATGAVCNEPEYRKDSEALVVEAQMTLTMTVD